MCRTDMVCLDQYGSAEPCALPQKASKAAVMSDERDPWDSDDWADWPESELDVDDEAFAAAIAKGRELEEAA